MESVLFIFDGVVVNLLAFSETNFLFRGLTDHGEKERERHDLASKGPKQME